LIEISLNKRYTSILSVFAMRLIVDDESKSILYCFDKDAMVGFDLLISNSSPFPIYTYKEILIITMNRKKVSAMLRNVFSILFIRLFICSKTNY
jgi:hypothetical protein